MSSATKTDIVNAALRHLGAQRVTSIDDNVPRAKAIKDIYEMVKRKLLEEMKPSFAVKRSSLTQSGTDPDFGYERQFELPADFIIAVKENEGYPYEIEGQKVLTDQTVVELVYIFDVTDTSYFTPAFVKAFYMALAAEASYALTESASNRDALFQQAEIAKMEAMGSDSAQDDTGSVLTPNAFLGGRGGGSPEDFLGAGRHP